MSKMSFSRSGFIFEPTNQSSLKSERRYMHKVKESNDVKKLIENATLPNTVDNFLSQSQVEKESPIGRNLRRIRFDSQGKPIKRTIVGNLDEFGNSK